MSQNEPEARMGPGIREFLCYYVLFLLKRQRLTAHGIIERTKEESACNRDYRHSGQLLIQDEDLRTVLTGLKRENLIESASGRQGVYRAARS